MWYALQLTVYSTVIYYYVTDIAPEANIGQIMMFAYLITFLVTWMLSKVIDAI